MRGIARAACWALLSAATIFSQTSTKPAAGAAGLGTTESGANADKNIRAYIELLRSDVKTSKSQIMAEVMQLNTDQATKFWPIYKGFETEYSRLGDQILAVVMKYADEFENITDELADQLGQQILSIEQQRNALKKTYYDRVKQGLGGIVAMRFLQVENQLERIIDLQVAASLPVIEAR